VKVVLDRRWTRTTNMVPAVAYRWWSVWDNRTNRQLEWSSGGGKR